MKDNINIENKKWEFDEEVTKCFDNMLSRSIPDYENMRSFITKLSSNYLKEGDSICDIGCSNGLSIEGIVNKYKDSIYYKLCDISDPMLQACKNKYIDYIKKGVIEVENIDLRDSFPEGEFKVILSVLTLQFTPIEYRQKIIQNIYNSLPKNGVFILVEKVLGNSYELDELLKKEYYNLKSENCYTQEQITNKRKSLEGVLVPVTSKWNEDLLEEAGFTKIDCFWRCLNFCGWIAIK